MRTNPTYCAFAMAVCLTSLSASGQLAGIEFPDSAPTITIDVLAFEPSTPFATWQDTGIVLKQNDVLYVAADGDARWHADAPVLTPSGTGDPGPQPGAVMLPGVSFMALIAKAGDELIDAHDYTSGERPKGAGYVGTQLKWTKTTEDDARLYLAINEGPDADNTGNYTAKIWVVRNGSVLDASAQKPIGSPVEPIPTANALEGERIFHGTYRHYVRGQRYEPDAETWIHRTDDGALRALSVLPFFSEATYVETDASLRPTEFALIRGAISQFTPFETRVTFGEDAANQAKYTPGDIVEDATFSLNPDALFDYNARPDSYVLAHVLLRRFELKEGNSAEWLMCDWGHGEEGPGSFPTYNVRVAYQGVEPVAVPAGRFQAHHVRLTQLSSASTFFKKAEGHITEFWLLDDYTIVRLVRHREPYELQLATADSVESLPGYEGEANIVPVFIQKHDHSSHQGQPQHDHHEH